MNGDNSRRAKAIMIQGTMSNVGKSWITAGLCRVFHQDGYRVAPFKSQNMALNSFVTSDGLEMGRAQVMQAEAAGVLPCVQMNPILLKPTSEVGSQVIVNGESIGTMKAADYFRMKTQLIPEIQKAYDFLSERFDIIVLEGAGSPAEINLKQQDIVNMGMAQLVSAPVLLVGDIDRGGVFASLYGTMALLERDEQAFVKGMLINKFRGDRTILQPGLTQLETLVQTPVVGVLPYLDLHLDEEDSLSRDFRSEYQAQGIDLAVIRFPRMANFTDFAPLEGIDGVSVRYVTQVRELGRPDLVFLPGTKNTIGDLIWMRESGLEAAVKKMVSHGTPVFGICGGYQMLGERLSDPDHAEYGGVLDGMGLLPVCTTFTKEKIRKQTAGTFGTVSGILSGISGLSFEGYEIHMGQSVVHAGEAFTRNRGNAINGVCKGKVYGTYVHGIFDRESVRTAFLDALAQHKGICLETNGLPDRKAYKESQYESLAQAIRQHVDLKQIYNILEAGV